MRGKKESSVLLQTSFGDWKKGSTVRAHSVLKSSCITGVPKPWLGMTSAEMSCMTSSGVVMAQPLVDNTVFSCCRKHAATLEAVITGHPQVLLRCNPSPTHTEAMRFLENWDHLSFIKCLNSLLPQTHPMYLMVMVKWLDRFDLKQSKICCKHLKFLLQCDHFEGVGGEGSYTHSILVFGKVWA